MDDKKTIIIIGSSSNVLKCDLGHKIDMFDVVIRFNRAPTLNFEKHIGSKTTNRYVNCHVITNNKKDNDDITFVPTLRNQTIISDTIITKGVFYKHYHETCEYTTFSRDNEFRVFKEKICKVPGYEGFKNFRAIEPSMGLGVICKFLNEGYTPTLYGFHIDSDNHKVSPHYWKEKLKVGLSHDFKYERELIKQLIKDKFVKYLK